MQTILFNILLLMTVIWLLVGILFLWQQLHTVRQKVKEESKKKSKQKQKQSTSSVTQDQVEQARQVLVGKSKSYRERYDEISKEITTNSQKIPDVPDTSSKEKSADNPNTFAGKNSAVSEETKEAEGTEDDNEMQVDYTMDEPDEDTIIREELQIADDSLPEVSPSSILARDIIRVNGWHRNDDAIDEENEAEAHEMLQSIRGTQLMDYIKEATLKQEQDHQKLLAAIRKVEEAELQENDTKMTSAPETDKENNNEGTTEEKPLSYYL